jgi:hypothetical protein
VLQFLDRWLEWYRTRPTDTRALIIAVVVIPAIIASLLFSRTLLKIALVVLAVALIGWIVQRGRGSPERGWQIAVGGSLVAVVVFAVFAAAYDPTPRSEQAQGERMRQEAATRPVIPEVTTPEPAADGREPEEPEPEPPPKPEPRTKPAEADSRIKTNGCKVYDVNLVDPIAFTSHLHEHFGNTSTTNSSTGQSLVANAENSCSAESDWFTSASWYPTPRRFDAERIAVYYRDPRDMDVRPIPMGLKMLTREAIFRSDGTTTMHFPNCVRVDALGRPVLDSADHMSHLYDANGQPCPSTYPYRIPRISYLIQWEGDRTVTEDTQISIGDGQWGPAGENMHADYFSGLQREFNFDTAAGPALIDLCLNDVPNSVEVADPRCGEPPENRR